MSKSISNSVSNSVSLTLVAIAVLCPWLAAWGEECDTVDERLRQSELKMSTPNSKLSAKKLEKIALLSKEVESRRTKYARYITMYLEKIGSDKDVDQSRIDYEKAQIALAGEWNQVRQVLPIIKKQEKIVIDWKAECGHHFAAPTEQSSVNPLPAHPIDINPDMKAR